MICFDQLDEQLEILSEELDEEHLDLEVLKIFFEECEEQDSKVKVSIWRIYFEICDDHLDFEIKEKGKSLKKNL